METITLFFATYFFTLPFLIGLFVFGVFLERSQNFLGVFIAGALIYCAYGFFLLTTKELLIYSALYIPIGLVWSIYRYKRWVDKSVQDIRTNFNSNMAVAKQDNHVIAVHEREKQSSLEQLAPQKNLSLISSWVLVWPFSVVENLSSDILDSIQVIIKSMFRRVFNKIYQNAISKPE